MKIDFNNSAAFEPFFDEIVEITATRPSGVIAGAFRACVLPITFVDPYASVDSSSEVQKFSVLIPKNGEGAWIERIVGSKPVIGDRVDLKSGVKTVVTRVATTAEDQWELETKEC